MKKKITKKNKKKKPFNWATLYDKTAWESDGPEGERINGTYSHCDD